MCNTKIVSGLLLCLISASFTVAAARKYNRPVFDINFHYGFENVDGYSDFTNRMISEALTDPAEAITEKYPNSRFGLVEHGTPKYTVSWCRWPFQPLLPLSERPIAQPYWWYSEKRIARKAPLVAGLYQTIGDAESWIADTIENVNRVKLVVATAATEDLMGTALRSCRNTHYPTAEMVHAKMEEQDAYAFIFARPNVMHSYTSIFSGSKRVAVLPLNYDTFTDDVVKHVHALARDISPCQCRRRCLRKDCKNIMMPGKL